MRAYSVRSLKNKKNNEFLKTHINQKFVLDSFKLNKTICAVYVCKINYPYFKTETRFRTQYQVVTELFKETIIMSPRILTLYNISYAHY